VETNPVPHLVKELTQIASYRASLQWIPLCERFPDSGEHVLVRLAEGRIEGGEWRAELGRWTHAPSVTWGQPVEWAAFLSGLSATKSETRRS
jgi:hypothetical protein